MKPKNYVWDDGRELSVEDLVRHLAVYRARREAKGLPFDEGQAKILTTLIRPVLQDVDLSSEERATTALRIAEALGAEIRLSVTSEGTGIEVLSEVAAGSVDLEPKDYP